MKKKLLGVLGFAPACIIIPSALVLKFMYWLLDVRAGSINEDMVYGFLAIIGIIIGIGGIIAFIGVIVFFIYNLKNIYIYPDKRIGWGYLLICLSIFAMPVYWYKFIRE